MTRRTIWEIEVRHDGLGEYRHIKGFDRHVVEQKASALKRKWDDQWDHKQAMEQARNERDESRLQREQERRSKLDAKEALLLEREFKKQQALELSDEAQASLSALQTILKNSLEINHAIDWENLKSHDDFPENKPQLQLLPEPADMPTPRRPKPDDQEFTPVFSWLDYLLPGRKKSVIKEHEDAFDHAVVKWAEAQESTQKINKHQRSEWVIANDQLKKNHQNILLEWAQRREIWQEKQRNTNLAIDQDKSEYLESKSSAIADYCEMVLANSACPDYFPKEWDMEYVEETRILIVEYRLPSPDSLPTLKTVTYVQSRDEFKESHLTDKERDSIYDTLIYQIVLSTLYELFKADVVDALDAIVFNGMVTSIDRATGKEVTACVVSIQAKKPEFMTINLNQVDPRACFKSLKGIAATKVSGLAAVAPVLVIDRTDRRFVDAYGVADGLDESTNLATIPWEDFEHLIREIFEKEFASNGGEVKVTQASRDGGVDAIAFDPDPIRGGKIVIQAKRYTNTVGVSAVRDLYGTVMNEGATKGILVSTANYGPDAYSFAQGKPLTLLNGSNLLHLLERHGHPARIDLHEAKLTNSR